MSGRLKHVKHRHGALYKQILNEYVQNGYTLREAMEIVGDYLDLHEEIEDLDNDEDFSRDLYDFLRYE